MRKKLFRFFLAISAVLLLLTGFLFTQLSYVGVGIQYVLIPALAISFIFTWLLYKEDAGYFDS